MEKSPLYKPKNNQINFEMIYDKINLGKNIIIPAKDYLPMNLILFF